MDVEAYIAQMEQLLADARPVPLSASVMVSRQQFEEALSALRNHLPEELRQSRWVIKERDEVLAQAAREAEQTREDAATEAARLVSETEVVHRANREAERVLNDAHEQARVLKLEAEDYVDGKLANFEIVLQKILSAVEKGRDRLRGRMASDELAQELTDEPEADGEPGTQFYNYESADDRGLR